MGVVGGDRRFEGPAFGVVAGNDTEWGARTIGTLPAEARSAACGAQVTAFGGCAIALCDAGPRPTRSSVTQRASHGSGWACLTADLRRPARHRPLCMAARPMTRHELPPRCTQRGGRASAAPP